MIRLMSLVRATMNCLRREHRARAIGVEDQQAVQREAGADPRRDQLPEIARQHQQDHGGDGQAEPADEDAVARIAVQVVAAELDDQQADEGDQPEHDRTQRVQADAEPEFPQPRRG
ncbi:MAG: hypothetical protein R2851_06100 [Caldilineaceae bacterium]